MRRTQWEKYTDFIEIFVSYLLIRATKRLRRLSDDESHDEEEDDDIYENENKPFEFPKKSNHFESVIRFVYLVRTSTHVCVIEAMNRQMGQHTHHANGSLPIFRLHNFNSR